MARRMYDFACQSADCGAMVEELVDPDIREIPCPHCGTAAKRLISVVRIDRTAIALTPGASPESIAHFDRIHRDRKAVEERRWERHQDYGSAPGAD